MLNDWFREPLTIDSDDDRWYATAKSDPSAWKRRDNPITERVRRTLCQDQDIDPNDPGGVYRTLRTIASDLMGELGREDLVVDSIERCRRRQTWKNLNVWQMKAAIIVEAAKIRAEKNRPLITKQCPNCFRVIPIGAECECEERADFR